MSNDEKQAEIQCECEEWLSFDQTVCKSYQLMVRERSEVIMRIAPLISCK